MKFNINFWNTNRRSCAFLCIYIQSIHTVSFFINQFKKKRVPCLDYQPLEQNSCTVLHEKTWKTVFLAVSLQTYKNIYMRSTLGSTCSRSRRYHLPSPTRNYIYFFRKIIITFQMEIKFDEKGAIISKLPSGAKQLWPFLFSRSGPVSNHCVNKIRYDFFSLFPLPFWFWTKANNNLIKEHFSQV